MDITRRVVLLSISLAVAAGLSLPLLIDQASEPDLSAPVELVQDDGEGALDEQMETLHRKSIRPVPVAPLVERRDDVAPRGGDDNDEAEPRAGQDLRSPRGNDSEDDDDRVDGPDHDADTDDGNTGGGTSDD